MRSTSRSDDKLHKPPMPATPFPYSSSPDHGLPLSPLMLGYRRKIVSVDIEDQHFYRDKNSQVNNVDLRLGDTMESKDSGSDEGICSPSVSPVDDSPSHKCIELHGN